MSTPERRNRETPPIASTVNMLSSVAPPTELPNFVTVSNAPPILPQAVTPGPVPTTGHIVEDNDHGTPEKFSPAIPPSKGEPTLPIRSPVDSQSTTHSPVSLPASTPELEQIGDPMPGSGLFTWVKDAVSSGGLLHRVAEKAKNSVDSMITTLDPQMKDYLNSVGDIQVVVASDKEVNISPIREGFQAVFGRASVIGFTAKSDVTAEQPVGYAAAYAAAKQRIAELRSNHPEINNNMPVVSLENFLYEAVTDRWYDVGLLVLSQPSLGIELQLQTQTTPVPSPVIAALHASTPTEYPHFQTGFSTTVGSVMAVNLQVHHTQWHEAATGVSRRELICMAAKSIAGSYKKLLMLSSAGT